MIITTMSRGAFDQEPEKAQKAARNGHVLKTEQGRPVHGGLTIEEYQPIIGRPINAGGG